jgi:hypothetical protein
MTSEAPVWEYQHIVRRLNEEAVVDEKERNALGAAGWELPGVVTDSRSVHYYFKRLTRI